MSVVDIFFFFFYIIECYNSYWPALENRFSLKGFQKTHKKEIIIHNKFLTVEIPLVIFISSSFQIFLNFGKSILNSSSLSESAFLLTCLIGKKMLSRKYCPTGWPSIYVFGIFLVYFSLELGFYLNFFYCVSLRSFVN